MEGEIGRFRRNHLVPVPAVDSIAELNEFLAAADAADDARRIEHRVNTVGTDFAFEVPLLGPLPVEVFETGIVLNPRVDRYSRITVRQCHYSVPARFIGHRVHAVLRASELVVTERGRVLARHERATTRGAQVLSLDHYLEILVRKPGALPGATALVQARASGAFTATHEAFWAAARKDHGDSGGTRALVEVLLLHRHLPAEHVIAGITAALKLGAANPDIVAIEARRAARPAAGAGTAEVIDLADHLVERLGERRLPVDTRPAPTTDAYDELLTDTSAKTRTKTRTGARTGTGPVLTDVITELP